MAAELRQSPPTVIAVHGGDGTLHKTVTALGRAFGADPLPPIAILCGGTMNVVATSLRIRERPGVLDGDRRGGPRADQPLETIRRRCLRIGDELGLPVRQRPAGQLPRRVLRARGLRSGRAVWLLLRAFFSALWRGPFMRRLFKRFEGSVRVDGALLERTAFVGLMAGTVREVGLGFKLVHRADDDPERFGVLAIHRPSLALALDLRAVQRGRGHRAQPGVQRRGLADGHCNRRTAAWPTRSTATSTARRSQLAISAGTAHRFREAALRVDCAPGAAIPWSASDELVVSAGRDEGAVRG